VIADYAAGRASSPVHHFVGHEFPVRTIAIAPGGGGEFYAGDDGGSGRLWNLNDRQPSTRVLAHHTQRVNSALFTPDGNRLLTASDDGDVCVCEARSGKLLKKLDHRGDAAAVVGLAVTGDGQRAITVGE